ncbi:2-dehydro-3-deoxygluconokinase [Paenibacillus albidus]|uniref:2-dehydro-3-deoxygluconokinase n=1 Tax=Paenibacillus albidus TaxID=2041023 RepID=A0A917FLA4_9BACL|nr:sugar kinase [Paenibacillus albidus]GGF89482.1 2-dehydro-3-deoxygluconokinase [Paenibacillus albidus]
MSKVAAFGEVMMRLQVPGYETLEKSSRLDYSFSGSGVNVAAALARYGHTGYIITTLPDTPVGDAALAYLRKLGIDTAYVNRGGKQLGMYFLENGFGVRPGRVTYSDRRGSSFNTSPLKSYEAAAIASHIEVLHLCGITLAMNDNVRLQMKQLATEVKGAGGKVVFDCNYRPSLWGDDGYAKARPHYEDLLELADIAMMNEKDAECILGIRVGEYDRITQLKQAIPEVARRFRLQTVAGTHREINGDNTHSLTGYIYTGETFRFSRKLTFSVHDRIGAGDAFASAVIHGELKGDVSQHTVDRAAAAAMLAHTVAGDTALFTEAEVSRVLTDHIGDVER